MVSNRNISARLCPCGYATIYQIFVLFFPKCSCSAVAIDRSLYFLFAFVQFVMYCWIHSMAWWVFRERFLKFLKSRTIEHWVGSWHYPGTLMLEKWQIDDFRCCFAHDQMSLNSTSGLNSKALIPQGIEMHPDEQNCNEIDQFVLTKNKMSILPNWGSWTGKKARKVGFTYVLSLWVFIFERLLTVLALEWRLIGMLCTNMSP